MKPSQVLKKANELTHTVGLYAESFLNVSNPKERKYCALGLLLCKKGFISNSGQTTMTISRAMEAYGVTLQKYCQNFDCSECQQKFSYMSDFVVHMNDKHTMSFKAIGEALEAYGL